MAEQRQDTTATCPDWCGRYGLDEGHTDHRKVWAIDGTSLSLTVDGDSTRCDGVVVHVFPHGRLEGVETSVARELARMLTEAADLVDELDAASSDDDEDSS